MRRVARYRLRTADATHLATAMGMGARRFITNNKRDFGPDIEEIDVTYPEPLLDPAGGGLGGVSAETPGRGD